MGTEVLYVYSIKDPLRTGGRPPVVAVNLSLFLQLQLYDYTALFSLSLSFVCVRLNKRKCLLMDDVMTASKKQRGSGRVLVERLYPFTQLRAAAFII